MYEIAHSTCPPYFFVALTAASIFLGSLRASNIRITSIPFSIDFFTNASTTSSA